MGKNINIRYGTVKAKTAQVARNSESGLERAAFGGYDNLIRQLDSSGGESIGKLRRLLEEEKKLVTAAARFYKDLAGLIDRAAEDFRVIDNRAARGHVHKNRSVHDK